MTRIGVLGLGEAGSAIAAGLVAAGAEVHGYDPKMDIPVPAGVSRHRDPRHAVARSELVLAIAPAAAAAAALSQVLSALPPQAIYADLSTASPELKRRLAGMVATTGLGFVDVALMAPVVSCGLATPALVSGPAALAFVATMEPLGMPVVAIGDEAGQAATRKLLRSLVMKGLAQLLLESLEAADAAGVADETWADLLTQLSTLDEALVRRLVTGTRLHAGRRLHEMEAVVELLTEVGVEPTMSRATTSRLRRLN